MVIDMHIPATDHHGRHRPVRHPVPADRAPLFLANRRSSPSWIGLATPWKNRTATRTVAMNRCHLHRPTSNRIPVDTVATVVDRHRHATHGTT